MNLRRALLALALCLPLAAAAIEDPRFCGPPARDAQGKILRSTAVLHAFERQHPKPGPGWYRDHVIPLACGGCDSISNIQWLPERLWRDKSTWERRTYGGRRVSTGCP